MTQEQRLTRVAERTPEQHAAVRRRALPVGIAAAAMGLAGVILPLLREVSAYVPPNLLAVNLASCAILMGAGILFYARGTTGTRVAAVSSLAAILLGMAGMLLFTWHAARSRLAREELELGNVRAIALTAGTYASDNGGAYPPDMLALLEAGLPAKTLQSPYGRRHELFNDFERVRAATPPLARQTLVTSVETAADYIYVGGDLRGVPTDAAGSVLVAVSANPVLRQSLAVATADGKSRFVKRSEVLEVVAASDAARAKMGRGAMHLPRVLESAQDTQPR